MVQSADEFLGVFKKFTESNLESYQIKNAEGLTCTTRKNKYLSNAVVEERESDVLVTFRLADVDMVQKQLAELKSEVEEVKEGQDVQDEAIYDLGKNVSRIVEGEE